MKIICPICHQSSLRKLKKIKDIQIFECLKCSLSIIPKNHISKRTNWYSLKDYRNEANRFKKRFIQLARIVHSFVPKGKVLDVGSGFGLFSSLLNKLGDYYFHLIDKEIEPYYFQKAKNVKFEKIDFVNFIKNRNEKYNLVLMFDILEHFKDPLFVLKETNNTLNKKGYLVIQTPNYQSLMAKVCHHWSWWMVEDHKIIFSPKSIKKLLNLAGFEIVYFKTYEDWYDFKKNLDGNFVVIKNKLLRKITKIIIYPSFFLIYFLMRKIIWHFDCGGAIFLVAKRYNRNNEK